MNGSSEDAGSPLDEKPSEFLASIANTGGRCDGQAIIPEGDRYLCRCSCGEWQAEASSQAQGLRLARAHTGSTPG